MIAAIGTAALYLALACAGGLTANALLLWYASDYENSCCSALSGMAMTVLALAVHVVGRLT